MLADPCHRVNWSRLCLSNTFSQHPVRLRCAPRLGQGRESRPHRVAVDRHRPPRKRFLVRIPGEVRDKGACAVFAR